MVRLPDATSLACAAPSGLNGSTVTWNVTKHLALRGGYDVLWLNRRALAPDQVDANATQNNFITPIINTKGTTMFYGTSFGVELKF